MSRRSANLTLLLLVFILLALTIWMYWALQKIEMKKNDGEWPPPASSSRHHG